MAEKALSKATMGLFLILSLEEEAVARVLRYLSPEEIRKLHELAGGELKPTQEALITACRSFLSDTQRPVLMPGEGKSYIKKLTQRSLGRDESQALFESDWEHPLSRIEQYSPQAVASLFVNENPDIIAAVLAKLSPAYSSSVLSGFDKELQARVLSRIAKLGDIPGSTIETLCHAVEEQLSAIESEKEIGVDGFGKTASILQRLKLADTEEVLGLVAENDPELASKLRRAMFNFEDLLNVQGRGIQSLIKEVSNNQLLLALKTASDELKDRIMASVSKRAAEVLLDDLMAMGPVKLSEVEQAQQEIVDTALRLEAEGKIVIAGRGGEALV